MDVEQALEVLSALSNETRLWAFRLLVQAGPEGLAAGEIAEALGAPQNSMSSHLKILAAAELIGSRREGRSIVYSARYETVGALVVFLMEDCCAGNRAVCAPVAESLVVSGRPSTTNKPRRVDA